MDEITKMDLSISIITPSYNQGRFIERTIQSVLNQNIPNLEYLIFDSQSTDETLSVLQKYSTHLLWLSEKDTGQAAAINKGLRNCTGDIIGWLNSDDVYVEGALQKVLKIFYENPQIQILYGDAYHINTNDQFIEKYPTEKWRLKRLKKTCYLSQPAVFFRRSILSHGLLDENLTYCLDYEYWLRLGLKGLKFHYVPEVLAHSRLYPETKTLRDPAKCYEETCKMLQEKLGHIPNTWILNYTIAEIKKSSQYHFADPRFLLKAIFKSAQTNFKKQGILRGGWLNLMLPQAMFTIVYRKVISK